MFIRVYFRFQVRNSYLLFQLHVGNFKVSRMMMMDMGMYGTYGKSESYPNYVFGQGNGHHHHHHHHLHHHAHQTTSSNGVTHVHPIPPSPELAPTHYYPQTAVAAYSSSSSESFLTAESGTSSSTPPQGFYSPTGAVLHDDGTTTTAIISSENGLSYTNLDYASSSSSYPAQPQGQQQIPVGSLATTNDPHQSYHIQQGSYREDHHHHHQQQHLDGGIQSRDQEQLHHQSSSHHHHPHHHHHQESEYQIAVGGAANYLHQLPNSDEMRYHGPGMRQTDFPGHAGTHYKEESPDPTSATTNAYHTLQQSHSLQSHVHGHHHQQQHSHVHHNQQPQQQQQPQQPPTQVPTYKWMQVKRNVPKPVGEQTF